MVREFGPVLVTTTLKVKSPPGAARINGVARLVDPDGGDELMMVTVASSVAVTTVPWRRCR